MQTCNLGSWEGCGPIFVSSWRLSSKKYCPAFQNCKIHNIHDHALLRPISSKIKRKLVKDSVHLSCGHVTSKHMAWWRSMFVNGELIIVAFADVLMRTICEYMSEYFPDFCIVFYRTYELSLSTERSFKLMNFRAYVLTCLCTFVPNTRW